MAELSDRIADLTPEERRVILAALEIDRHAETTDRRDRVAAYCDEYPYDPLCRKFDRLIGDSRSDRRVGDHLDGFADGGGCPEAWEYLSAYRDARRR
ncbi:hypothetical protein [Halorussus sp. MSC15.2]|uniref:hypothetical protein n=1 Tax=Halorussus sp. MSC15.2 TaxID=2283638 RepID=UPI0013D5D4F0|nr:hypothetical protein [Halorussus sp. MSC15.2]NEU57570.1 hypothetical protein [Halorussus sp. MSC15.2]